MVDSGWEAHLVLASDEFSPLPGRDAYPGIRGFVYQVERTILAWLTLPPGTALMCEAGEDIDYLRRELSEHGQLREASRLLEQVKFRKERFSLRSVEVLEGLGNFLAHCERNRGHDLRFRFFTNTSPAKEREISFPDHRTGIATWQAIRRGAVPESERPQLLAAIRAALRRAATGKPGEDKPEQAAALLRFLDLADDDQLVAGLINRVEFVMGSPEVEDLRRAVQQQLRLDGHAGDGIEAERLYDALFAHVFHLLGRPDPKYLDRRSLADIVATRGLGAADRAVLERIDQVLAVATRHFAAIERDLALVREQTSQEQLERAVTTALLRNRDLLQSGATRSPLPDGPPSAPAYRAPRPALERAIAAGLARSGWVALIGLAEVGKTDLARATFETWPSAAKRWLSFTDHAADFVEHLTEQLWLWCRDSGAAPRSLARRPSLQEMLLALIERWESGILLVLDHLPEAAAPAGSASALARIAAVLPSSTARVLSTGQHELPGALLDAGGSNVSVILVPPLDATETTALLRASGAPPGVTDGWFPDTVQALSGGIPPLVAEVARWLRAREWVVPRGEVAAFFGGDPALPARERARRRVAATVRDASTLALLDRLSLVGTTFSLDLVAELGTVNPVIDWPETRLDALAGIWVGREDRGRYAVSPLLRNVGEDHLPPTVRREVHRTVAHAELRGRTLDASGAVRVCGHLLAGEDWETLAEVIVRVLSVVQRAAQVRPILILAWTFPPGSAWPAAVPAHLRIAVRALQIRVLALDAGLVAAYEEDLERLIAAMPDDDATGQLAVGFARFHAGVLRSDLPPATTALRSLEAARAFANAGMEQVVIASQRSLFWVAVPRVRDRADVRALVGLLESLPTEERRGVMAAIPSPGLYLSLAERCLGAPDGRPEEDATLALRALDELANLARGNDVAALSVAARRARAQVLATRPNGLAEALDELGSPGPESTPFDQFITGWTAGRLLLDHGRVADARVRLAEALEVPPDGDTEAYRADALADGMVAAARSGRYDDARRLGRMALGRLRRGSPDGGPDLALWLLGELALIRWQAGDRRRATRTFAIIAARLMAVGRRHPGDLTLLVRLNYALMWAADSLTDRQMLATAWRALGIAGDRSATIPDSGFFWYAGVGDAPPSVDQRPTFWQLGRLAAAVGDVRLAREAAARGAASARTHDDEVAAGLADGQWAAAEAHLLGDFDAAVAAALRCARVMAVTKNEPLEMLPGPHQGLEIAWSALSEEVRSGASEAAVTEAVCWPVVARLLADSAGEQEAMTAVDRLGTAIQARIHELDDPAFWAARMGRIRLACLTTPRREVEQASAMAGALSNFDAAMLYVALARVAPPLQSVVYQARALDLMQANNAFGDFILAAFARWLRRFWRGIVERRSFLLAIPTLLRQDLAALSSSHSTFADARADSARVLLAADAATGNPLPQQVRATLRAKTGV